MGIGKRILQRMAELGIKSNVALAQKMNGSVHPNTIGKWIGDKTKPRGENVIALAKALKISADLLLFDEGENIEQTKSLERIARDIVKAEADRLFGPRNQKDEDYYVVFSSLSKIPEEHRDDIVMFFSSLRIPPEDKDAILRQIRNLLKMYKETKTNE